MIPVLTDEPLTLSVNVPVSEPYFVDVILIAVTFDFAAVTGTAGSDYTYTFSSASSVSNFGIATSAKRAYTESLTTVLRFTTHRLLSN